MVTPQQHLAAGHRILDCEVRAGEVWVLFEDREIPAPDFRIGAWCPPFARFAVEAGLNKDLGETLVYLAGLPTNLEGPIVWPDEIHWRE